MSEFLADLRNVFAKVWMLLMLSVAWGISMSRITDNQHHPSDVVAGMVLGMSIAIMYIMRAIPRFRRVLSGWARSYRRNKTQQSLNGNGNTNSSGAVGVERVDEGTSSELNGVRIE